MTFPWLLFITYYRDTNCINSNNYSTRIELNASVSYVNPAINKRRYFLKRPATTVKDTTKNPHCVRSLQRMHF